MKVEENTRNFSLFQTSDLTKALHELIVVTRKHHVIVVAFFLLPEVPIVQKFSSVSVQICGNIK